MKKKTQKYLNANIFVFHFIEEQKMWNSVFATVTIPCNFQQNRQKKMAIGLNGINI
jgi:hypothetical protein